MGSYAADLPLFFVSFIGENLFEEITCMYSKFVTPTWLPKMKCQKLQFPKKPLNIYFKSQTQKIQHF